MAAQYYMVQHNNKLTLSKQEAQLPLREQGVSFALSSHYNATVWNLAFWVVIR